MSMRQRGTHERNNAGMHARAASGNHSTAKAIRERHCDSTMPCLVGIRSAYGPAPS